MQLEFSFPPTHVKPLAIMYWCLFRHFQLHWRLAD